MQSVSAAGEVQLQHAASLGSPQMVSMPFDQVVLAVVRAVMKSQAGLLSQMHIARSGSRLACSVAAVHAEPVCVQL